MATPAALMLAFSPFSGDASPSSMGLGHELLIQTENACGAFCLSSANVQFDNTLHASFSQAQAPQKRALADASIATKPIDVTTYNVSWHPFYDAVVSTGYRSTARSAERSTAGKVVKRMRASTQEIPLSVATRPFEGFSIGGRFVVRNIELKQETTAGALGKSDSCTVTANRWSADALWQRSESTGYGVSYISPTLNPMKAKSSNSAILASAATPKWTDPQEFSFSLAHFSSITPPVGVTFGPFENVFHASVSAVTWETGSPTTYAALVTTNVGKDGWNLNDTSGQTNEYVFDTLDPSLSASAGLESTWMRTALGSLSTMTHIRLNHLAAKTDSTGWQGGFGISLSTRYVSLQAATLLRDEDAGYAFSLSSSF